MKACVLRQTGPVETQVLEVRDVPIPQPGEGEVLIRVSTCGICRTDLHVVEGELPPKKPNIIPGHQIVGVIERLGPNAGKYKVGARVGVAWLHRTDGKCAYCRSGRENLCDSSEFTGYTVNGGYAEFTVAPEEFIYPIPPGFPDLQAAPLLCAGIIGFRSLRLAGLQPQHAKTARVGDPGWATATPGFNLGIYGFGAAGHVCLQVARHWGAKVFVATREAKHQQLARELGAAWTGGAKDPPSEKLDAAIIFAPAGELVSPALAALKKGGTVVLGGIHMSDIPSFAYPLIYHERSIRSVANNTRQDGHDFMRVAAEIPVRTEVQVFPLEQANQALAALKHDGIRGAAVLKVS